MAETCLYQFYCDYVPNPPSHPCNCKLARSSCDCISRFKPSPAPGILQGPPKPKGPKASKPLVRGFNSKVPLYSASVPRWWRSEKPRNETDPNIRAQAAVAGQGMRGRWAGGSVGAKGAYHANPNAYENSQQEDAPLWKRDREATAREGEKALNKPFDDPKGTPKSWSNPRDAEPDNADGIKRIGKRVIEDGVIEPSKGDGEGEEN